MVGARLRELIDIMNLNPNSFAQELGVSASIIYNIIGKRGSKPSCEILEKIKQVYPDTNMNWVISGEGKARLESTEQPVPINEIAELTNRIRQIEKLSEMRDKHISVLQKKVETLKKPTTLRKSKKEN